MNKYINPSAIFYIVILVIITILIGYASGANKTVNNKEIKGLSEIIATSTNTKTETNASSTVSDNKIINQNNMVNTINQVVTLETSMGNIDLELFTDKAPKTVANFLKLSKSGFYENTKFHRVIKDFMIQGGDPYTKGEDTSVYGTGGPGYKFEDEQNDLSMVRGMLAMANSGPNTNGSQFFIVTISDAGWLTGKHTIFGKVISGMDVVDKIEATKTTGEPYNRPITPVVINKVTVK